MTIDNSVIILRLSIIEKCYDNMKFILSNPLEEFLENDILQLAVERCLQLSAQAMADIGSHIIAQKNWIVPNSYSSIMTLLGNKKVIDPKLAQNLESFMGLRNILVHVYLSIDPELIYQDVKERVVDLKKFIGDITSFLTK